MALTNPSKIAEHTGRSLAIANKVDVSVFDAEYLLRKWIGDAKYDEIAADTSHDYYNRAQRAESFLALAIGLPLLNMDMRENGGLVKTTGFAESQNSLMGKSELDSYAIYLFARAKQLVRKIVLKSYNVTRPEVL